MLLEKSVRSTMKIQYVSITKTSWSILSKKIITGYFEKQTKPTNTFCGQNAELLIIKAGGAYSYHWALKD
jgi:hypothetical protein